MQTQIFRLVAIVAVASLLAMPAAADEGAGPYEALIKAKAGPVVAMKFVLKVEMNFGGQSRDQEVNGNAIGVVIDDSGLIMTAATNFDARLGIPRRMRSQVDIKTTPTNITVIFPGEDKEHPAILGAKDSKLGLAFVLIKDLGEKKLTGIDMENTAEPKVGDTLYGVSRMDQGFDYAPMCNQVRVIGKVTKPREMWALNVGGGFAAQPLYTAAGAVAGICVTQEGVGEESQSRPFVLPLKIASATVRMAMKSSAAALEEMLEAEEEAAENAAEEGDEKKPEGDEKPEGDGKKPEGDEKPEGDGKKPEGDEKPEGDGKKDEGDGKKGG